jgi:hypothetical protein
LILRYQNENSQFQLEEAHKLQLRQLSLIHKQEVELWRRKAQALMASHDVDQMKDEVASPVLHAPHTTILEKKKSV